MAFFRTMKALFILGLVAGIMAIDARGPSVDTKLTVTRIANMGSAFTKVQGYLIPKGIDSIDGLPNYEFRSTINGVPVQDKEFIHCRCGVLYRYAASKAEEPKPVLLCRGSIQKKGSQMPESVSFLFAAESLNLDMKVKGINLLLGKNAWKNLLANHASAATAAPSNRP